MQLEILPGVLDTLKHFNISTHPHCQRVGAAGEGPGFQAQQRSWDTPQCSCGSEGGTRDCWYVTCGKSKDISLHSFISCMLKIHTETFFFKSLE